MAQKSCSRCKGRQLWPQSLDSLYQTAQNACTGIQASLDSVRSPCDAVNIEQSEEMCEVLDSISYLDGNIKISTLSDLQCESLAEDLGFDRSDSTKVDIIKSLRDLDRLRSNVAAFFEILEKRLSSALDHGIYIFCASLIEVAREHVDEVVEYENFIVKQRVDLVQAVAQIKQQRKEWDGFTQDMHAMIQNAASLGLCLEDVQSQWQRIKEKTLEWIQRDRDYPAHLNSRINQNRDAIPQLQRDIQLIGEAEQRKIEDRRRFCVQMEALQKRRRELCKSLAHVRRAKRFSTSKLAAFNSDSSQKEGPECCEGESTVRKTDGGQNSTNKSSGTTNCENTQSNSKSQDGQKEYHRRMEAKLDKQQNEIRSALRDVEKRIANLQEAIDHADGQVDSAGKQVAMIKAEISRIERISADCREILQQRGKIQTFLQLQKGKINKSTRGGTPFDEACKCVARKVQRDWPRLYTHLPMHPPRSREQRQADISGLLGFHRMNVVLPRNRSAAEEAAAALAKWRLLSRRDVDVGGLATALERAGWPVWADEVRTKWWTDLDAAVAPVSASSDEEAASVADAGDFEDELKEDHLSQESAKYKEEEEEEKKKEEEEETSLPGRGNESEGSEEVRIEPDYDDEKHTSRRQGQSSRSSSEEEERSSRSARLDDETSSEYRIEYSSDKTNEIHRRTEDVLLKCLLLTLIVAGAKNSLPLQQIQPVRITPAKLQWSH
ncbi:unnamed protein product [Mesocestoides corti]|uniref:Death domain-containing protein n=2 Tax=Mesocestoides corti TaxID=53468 RepID=A0A0R3U1M8_MESCO|nr:unnamed protein product [Mesocestoides corti]